MKHPFKNLDRLAGIVSVLIRHGFGHLVEGLNLKEHIPFKGRAAGAEEKPRLTQAERIRTAFEELGPTFIKFGQALSIRSDLLPDDLIAELRKLQDAVPPFPLKEVLDVVREELGSPVEELYGTFDEDPLAAASIGQVHRATLKDGSPVVVKVQRPGIEKVIRTDLDIMRGLAMLLEKHITGARRFDPVGLVEEFEKAITRELDFVLEGRNGERFRENFSGDKRVHVPPVIEGLTKRRVLTTGHSAGKKVTEFKEAAMAFRHEIARRINDLYLEQILEDGFFHADPHPGNIFIMPDGAVCFHDFGIVGELDERTREHLTDLFLAFVERDMDWIVDTYLAMGVVEEEVDRVAFKKDIADFINAYYTLPMKEFSFAEVMRNLILVGKRYNIKVKKEFLLLGKTFMLVESMVRGLDPEFNLVENIRPYAGTLILRQLVPGVSRKEIYRTLRNFMRFSREFPADMARFLRSAGERGLELRLRHERLEDLESHIDRASNRLSFSLIVAAIIVGSSIIMQVHIGPSIKGIPLLGAAGYVIALFLVLWLVWSIFKSGRL